MGFEPTFNTLKGCVPRPLEDTDVTVEGIAPSFSVSKTGVLSVELYDSTPDWNCTNIVWIEATCSIC